jgi:hypothetical protein
VNRVGKRRGAAVNDVCAVGSACNVLTLTHTSRPHRHRMHAPHVLRLVGGRRQGRRREHRRLGRRRDQPRDRGVAPARVRFVRHSVAAGALHVKTRSAAWMGRGRGGKYTPGSDQAAWRRGTARTLG